MGLSWNEIRRRAIDFSREWADANVKKQRHRHFGMNSLMYLELDYDVWQLLKNPPKN